MIGCDYHIIYYTWGLGGVLDFAAVSFTLVDASPSTTRGKRVPLCQFPFLQTVKSKDVVETQLSGKLFAFHKLGMLR
jgi:hypothetical protein